MLWPPVLRPWGFLATALSVAYLWLRHLVLSPALPIVPMALLLVAFQDCGHVAYGFYEVLGGLFFRLPDGVTFAAHDVL